MATVRKVCHELQGEIDAACDMLLSDHRANGHGGRFLAGWRFHVTDTVCGRCKNSDRTLTVPKWAYQRGADYFLYYVAHELAHIFGDTYKHNAQFMTAFKKLCPPDFWHFELGYKPRAATAAGIKK